MSRPVLAVTRLAAATSPDADVLILGPSIGTSGFELWHECAPLLRDRFDVLGRDLPGHGQNPPALRFS